MLQKVVSRFRRHLRRPKAHSQQPPELRRWSDFINPFPHVSPGGYRRYYETHGMPEPKPLPPPSKIVFASKYPLQQSQSTSRRRQNPFSSSASSASSTSKFHPPIDPKLPFPSSSLSQTPFPHRPMKKSRTLSTITEVTSGPPSVRMPNLSNTSSLRRRRKQQLLRTPSIERDFPSRAPTMASTADLIGFSSNDSSSSHPETLDTPPTTVEGFEEEPGLLLKVDSSEEGIDPYDRPESRSSYCTARSDFSDV